MVSARLTALDPAPSVEIDRTRGLVRVYDPRVFGPGGEAHRDLFLRCVLSVDSVGSVRLDSGAAAAEIRTEPECLGEVLPQIMEALRGRGRVLASRALPLPRGARGPRFEIHRRNRRLTSWNVVEEGTGRLRLRHELLAGDHALARRVEHVLGLTRGVLSARYHRWRGCLWVHFQPDLIEPDTVIHLAEQALEEPSPPVLNPVPGGSGPGPGRGRVRFGLANTNLGAAALGDLGVPGLTPVSGVILVGSNLKMLRQGADQLRRKKLGLPVLYTAIVVGTVASGQFLSAAVMAWMFRYWKRRAQIDVATERQLLLDEHVAVPPTARLARAEGAVAVVPRERLRPGDRVVVKAGEVVPADGRVLEGRGVLDEHGVRGLEGVSRKRGGDPALAGSTLLFGQLVIEVVRLGQETRAAAIHRAVVAATTPAAAPDRPETADANPRGDLAERAVAPTLATAGLALLAFDVATAVTVMRPDYATGPSVAQVLSTIGDVSQCLSRGIVVRAAPALDHLGEVDLVVIAEYPELHRPELRVVAIESRTADLEMLIRLAGSIGRYLPDERGAALTAACQSRDLALLNVSPVDLSHGIGIRHGRRFVRLREHDDLDEDEHADGAGAMVLEIDGALAATFHFRAGRDRAAGRWVCALRQGRRLEVVLWSDRPATEAAALARDLGTDGFQAGVSGGDLAEYLRRCRSEGRRVALVGQGRRVAEAMAEAHVAIGLVGDDEHDLDATPAPLVLLQPRLERLLDLWGLAETRLARTRAARQLTLVPNVFCVAGALFLGFSSLTNVVITNLGTLGTVTRASEELRRADRTGRWWRRPLATIPRLALASPERTSPAPAPAPDGRELRLRNLPPELGSLLIAVGCLGMILPGVIGTPALVAGGLALWPRTFGPIESWFEQRFPRVHRLSLEQIARFLADLERRYSDSDSDTSHPVLVPQKGPSRE
jgi:Cu2+-exporting ATPase